MKLKKYLKNLDKQIDKISYLASKFLIDLCEYSADGDMIMDSDYYEKDGLLYLQITYDIPVIKKLKKKK